LQAGAFEAFATGYRARLDADVEAQAALEVLEALARERRVALLCREADPAHCHRTVLAERLRRETGVRVTHLDASSRDAPSTRTGAS
jgi:uncharacterized protein YeaO (DUF488 family)